MATTPNMAFGMLSNSIAAMDAEELGEPRARTLVGRLERRWLGTRRLV